ncbi:MAG TPA: hypothetical protein QF753_11600 [Victivallales bacterium]|nr:hypothetical protein [Victivallales bacterium]
MGYKFIVVGNDTDLKSVRKIISCDYGEKLLSELCTKPIPIPEIRGDCLAAFKKLNAVRIDEDNKAFLNFTCLSKDEIKQVKKVSNIIGKDLADTIISNLKISKKLENSYDTEMLQKILFILIGCVSLDWNGLKILEALGYIPILGFSLTEQERNSAELLSYVLIAEEKFRNNVKEVYCGSHNICYKEIIYTTFGDNLSKTRKSFPDLNWDLKVDEQKFPFINYYIENGMGRIYDYLISNETDKNLERILGDLKYIKDGKINIPIFNNDNYILVKDVIDQTNDILTIWLQKNIPQLEYSFRDLNSLKMGVSFKEVLVELWHLVFGYANKHLARSCFIFNPYSKESDFKGYLPCIHLKNLLFE